jgi:alpha-beta hydrolase superfamily lysophospholipase
VTQFPGWNLVVIGHSHGGTLALRAIDCDELRDRVRIVCMSTPFLQAFPRNLPSGVPLQLAFAISFLIGLASYFAVPSSYRLGLPQIVFGADVWDFAASRINGNNSFVNRNWGRRNHLCIPSPP